MFTYFGYNQPELFHILYLLCHDEMYLPLNEDALSLPLIFQGYARILFHLCRSLSNPWPVLTFWLRKMTNLVSIEIKICFKDEMSQWDSMRACFRIFSHCVWKKKHLPHLWWRIWNEVVERNDHHLFLLFSSPKPVHGMLKKLKTLSFMYRQRFLTWIYKTPIKKHFIIINYFHNFCIIVSTIFNKHHSFPEYLNSNGYGEMWHSFSLMGAFLRAHFSFDLLQLPGSISIFVESLKWRSRMKDMKQN